MFPLNIVVHHSNQLNINDFTNIIFIFFLFFELTTLWQNLKGFI